MLVKFTDIHIIQDRFSVTDTILVEKSEALPITKTGAINFEAIFSTSESIESRMLHWLGKELLYGEPVLVAMPHERRSNGHSPNGTNHAAPIPINDLSRILPQFLYYFLYVKKYYITVNAKNGLRISNEKLAKLTICVPSITAQQNIADCLRKAIKKTEIVSKKLQKKIADLKAENNRVISNAFGIIHHYSSGDPLPFPDTKIVRIKEAGAVKAGKTPNGSIPNYFGNEYPFYNQTAFDKGMDIHFACRHLSARGLREAGILNENSILVCHIGPQFGKAGIVREKGACSSQLLSISTFENVLPEYLYYQIISDNFQEQMKKYAAKLSISKSDFENLYIELAPIKKQEQIVAFLKERNDYYNRKIQELTELLYTTEAKQLEGFEITLFSESD